MTLSRPNFPEQHQQQPLMTLPHLNFQGQYQQQQQQHVRPLMDIPRSQQYQQPPTRPTFVRFNKNPQYHTYQAPPDDEHLFHKEHQTSTKQPPFNAELFTVFKVLFKIIQFQHHLGKWSTLPQSLKRNLDNITPPESDQNLRDKIKVFLRVAGEQVKGHVLDDLQVKLNRNISILKGLNPVYKTEAIEVVYGLITNRLGKRVLNPRRKDRGGGYSYRFRTTTATPSNFYSESTLHQFHHLRIYLLGNPKRDPTTRWPGRPTAHHNH